MSRTSASALGENEGATMIVLTSSYEDTRATITLAACGPGGFRRQCGVRAWCSGKFTSQMIKGVAELNEPDGSSCRRPAVNDLFLEAAGLEFQTVENAVG